MRPSSFSTILVIAVAAGLVSAAVAQDAPINTEIQIRKIEPLLSDSPKIQGGYSKRSQGRPLKWLEVEVTFDRVPSQKEGRKFADELTFDYYILLNNDSGLANDGKPNGKPTLLTGSVTHVLTPADKDLHSVVFVSPRMLAKLFDNKLPVNAQQAIIDIGVEIKGTEGLMAMHTYKGQLGGTARAPVGWWTQNADKYTATSGLLLNKEKTPFAPLEWDYFEPVKQQQGN